MGPHKLSTDSYDEDLGLEAHQIQHTTISSDDSDDEAIGTYENYQPLDTMDNTEDMDKDMTSPLTNGADIEVPCLSTGSALPSIQCVEAEIEQHVWSEPRPQTLQIDLDSSTTAEILNVMAKISLPSTNIPNWARYIPEERWKDEFIQRIRQRNEA